MSETALQPINYLLSVAIGPVQDFIATARRSRDLWFGSWLLSEISKSVARTIADAHGVEALIFPAVGSGDLKAGSEFNIVNKILAVVPGTGPEVKRLAHEIEKEARGELLRLAGQTFKRLEAASGKIQIEGRDLGSPFNRDLAETQLDDLLEIYTAAVPLTDYEKDRERVESLLAARKATRDFGRVSWHTTFPDSTHVPKSSLDGQRESVFKQDRFKSLSASEQYRYLGVRASEQLCGVGLFKRNGNRAGENGFFSTSHVAALSLLAGLNLDGLRTDFNEYIAALEKCGLDKTNGLNELFLPDMEIHPTFGRYDGHLLFVERLGDFFDTNSENKLRVERERKKLKDATDALVTLRKKLKHKGFSAVPSPYYSLLLADGDSMGKAIEAVAKVKDGQVQHRKISEALSKFADSVKGIVNKNHSGCLVYAGGDDVLAFVPLHTAMACAAELAKEFESCLKDFGFDDKDGKPKSPTLSVGIAVAHHLDPLSDALEMVRRAEKAAKKVDGKNALAIIVDKRSGAAREAKGTWGTLNKRMEHFIAWHRAGDMPDGAAYQLKDMAARLTDAKGLTELVRKDLRKARELEALRILKRKNREGGQMAVDGMVIAEAMVFLDSMTDEIEVAEARMREKNPEAIVLDDSIERFADELIIAKIFAEAANLAEPRPTGGESR